MSVQAHCTVGLNGTKTKWTKFRSDNSGVHEK